MFGFYCVSIVFLFMLSFFSFFSFFSLLKASFHSQGTHAGSTFARWIWRTKWLISSSCAREWPREATSRPRPSWWLCKSPVIDCA